MPTSQIFGIPTYGDQIWYDNTRWCGLACFRGQSLPGHKGAGSQRPKKFWDPTFSRTVWPTKTNFCTITHIGNIIFSKASPTSRPEGYGPKPHIFGTFYMRAHSMRNNNQILHGDQTRCETKFTRSTANADARSVFGSQWRRSVRVSQVKPTSRCCRLHPTSMISKRSTIPVPDSLQAPWKISFIFHLTQVFRRWWCETCGVIQQEF